MYPSTGLQTAMNKIRELSVQEGSIYHQYVPVITDSTTIGEFGAPIIDSSNLNVMNDFVSLLKKIVGTAVNTKTFSNPLAELEGDRMPLGQFIEDVYVQAATPEKFDPNDFGGLLHKYEAKMAVQYLSVNSDLQYSVSMTREKIRNAFTSWGNLEDFISGIINSLYNGAYITRYNQIKGLPLAAYKANNVQFTNVTAVSDAATAKALVEKLRAAYTKMQLPNTAYNAWNKVKGDNLALKTWSNPEDIVVIISADVDAILSVQDWAYVFNGDAGAILGRKIVVDDFSQYNDDGTVAVDGSGIQAVIADKSWFKIKTQDFALDEFYNAKARCWNYYLNDTRMVSYSFFGQCMIFATEASNPTVAATDIDAASSSATVKAGEKVLVPFTITPANATSTITASSSAEGKATVQIKGRNVEITGVSAGSATITITANGHSDTISTTVSAASE